MFPFAFARTDLSGVCGDEAALLRKYFIDIWE